MRCTVQILHKGQISEMRTGEGKTLVAILPAVLNALTGQGVHVSAHSIASRAWLAGQWLPTPA